MIKGKRNILIIAAVVAYLFSTGVSYAVYSFWGQGGTQVISPLPQDEGSDNNHSVLDISGPHDQECLLNGAYFTKAEREVWEKRRPLTVMIENHQESRPQSGLPQADVVYEAVAEGGITRFLAVFYCGAAAGSRTDLFFRLGVGVW